MRFIGKVVLVLLTLSVSSNVFAWELSQVKVKHVQVSNSGKFYMSVDADTSVSGCTTHKGWLILPLAEGDPEVNNAIISLALAAYMSGTLVDVGSGTTGCIGGYSHLKYIRVGNYR